MFTGIVKGRTLMIHGVDYITSGSVGLSIGFIFDEEWNGLAKYCVFDAGSAKVSVLLDNNKCTIPHEVLEKPDIDLKIGVYGTNGEDIIIPTIWQVYRIHQGTVFGSSEPEEPTPSVIEQLSVRLVNVEEDISRIDNELLSIYDLFPKDTASGTIASFPDGGSGTPVKSLVVNIEAIQNLNGYDGPWFYGCGTNKFNRDTAISGSLNVSTGNTVTNNKWMVTDYIPMNTSSVTLSWDSGDFYQANICAYDSSKVFIPGSGISVSEYSRSHVFSLPSGTAYVRFSWSINVSGNDYPRNEVRVNSGSSDKGYAPYSNICPIAGFTAADIFHSGEDTDVYDTIHIILEIDDSAVYGGSLNVTTGVLTVDMELFRFKDVRWYSVTEYQNRFNSDNGIISVRWNAGQMPDRVEKTIAAIGTYAKSNVVKNFGNSVWNNPDTSGQYGYTDGLVINLTYDAIGMSQWSSDYTEVTNAFMSSSIFDEGYAILKLSTPKTYLLDPHELKTVYGSNSIWSNAGTINVVYIADTGLFIRKLLNNN